jgi:aminoglycoside phosphotransferase (APT) family kinase protein
MAPGTSDVVAGISAVGIVPRPSVPNATPQPNGAAGRVFNAADPSQVGEAFLSYFRNCCSGGPVGYLEPPVQIPDGWETYTYRLRLQVSCGMPPKYCGPLNLRIYASPEGSRRAQSEFSIERHLRQLSYPVPEPLMLEETSGLFGGPFLVREHVLGPTLFQTLLRHPCRLWGAPAEMAAFHRRLHLLPAAAFPSENGPFLSRCLDEMQALIRDGSLNGLRPGLRWLCQRCPAPPELPCILHLDFHPLNLVCGPGPALIAIDWTEADIGDMHADVATTLMLMACCPAGQATLWEKLTLPVGRRLLSRRYLRAYRRLANLDVAKLRYYRGLAALRRLCRYGRWLRVGPEVTGSKPCSVRHLTPHHIRTLQKYFYKWTGVAVRLL